MKYVCLVSANKNNSAYLGYFFIVGNFNKTNIDDNFNRLSPELRKEFQRRIDKKEHNLNFENFEIIFLGDEGEVKSDISVINEIKNLIPNTNKKNELIKFIQKIHDEGYTI